MGRADLSSYRASPLTNTPAIAFPSNLNWITSELARHPASSIKSAILSFQNASTQRDQAQAVKLLGVALKEAHAPHSNQKKSQPPCSCTQKEQVDQQQLRPLCLLAAPLLCAILFETPAATYGLRGAALRAILFCRVTNVQGFEKPVLDFLVRLESWKAVIVHWDGRCNKFAGGDLSWFPQAAADVTALSCILSDQQSRDWVLDQPVRVTSALHLISLAPNLYCHIFSDVQAKGERNQYEDGRQELRTRLNLSVMEAACDSSVKAAQDLINYLRKAREEAMPELTRVEVESVDMVLRSCSALLKLPTTPRTCAMACAVAYISGLLFRCSKDRGPEATAKVLRENVMSSVVAFPPFSQLSLLRAIMVAPAAKPALPFILYPPSDTCSNLYLFDLLVSLTTNSPDVHLRFLAMDALIVCVQKRHLERLSIRCRDIVLRLISERLQEPISGITAQVRDAMEALTMADGRDEESISFWTAKAVTFLRSDWLSRGIYAPLSVLVGHVGALRILETKPDCQSLAMAAAGVDARLAKPVSDWLLSFWKSLRAECCRDHSRFYGITLNPLARSLVHEENKTLRERVAEYILPVFFRAHHRGEIADCVRGLLQKIMDITKSGSALQIRGTISVLSAGRTFGAFDVSFADERVREMVSNGLSSSSEDIRSAALDLVVTSKMPTEPVSAEELDLLRLHLPVALMPGSSAGYRSRFRHSMRRLFERLATCSHAAHQGSGGWWMRERKAKYKGGRVDAFEKIRLELIRRIESFKIYCAHTIISSVYPGAPFSRNTTALEVAKLLSVNLGFKTSFGIQTPYSKSHVAGLIGCLLEEWERTRHAALQVLISFGDPTPGFNDLCTVSELQEFALPLLLSPRKREVDSGASIYRCIFQKYVLRAALVNEYSDINTTRSFIVFSTNRDSQGTPCVRELESPGLAYAESVLDSLEKFADVSERDFIHSCRFGLFHGHCLLLRYIIQDLQWSCLLSPSTFKYSRQFVKRFIVLYRRCINIALKGVSYRSVEEDFVTLPESTDDEPDESAGILLQAPKQLVSTSSFLSLKEIYISLGILCHEIPIDGDVELDTSRSGLISKDELRSIGDMFLSLFTNTRHWGVISGASEGLQLLCEKLLRSSENSSRNLPREWIARTLSMTLRGGLYVLRRSAGIPHLICAIVNAEAAIIKRSYENPLLDEVVTTLLGHLERNHMFTEDSLLEEKRSRQEESVAHALNLLRSLFLDGNIASTILNYLESTTIVCIKAFCSASWLIRNSALMLFSALVRRGVGVCSERKSKVIMSSFEAATGTSATFDGERRLNGVTAFQFFARYPKLHPFLLEQLTSNTNRHDREGVDDHPALFPTLYLLSSLSPSTVEDPTSSLSMSPFREILRDCLHWRSNYVRRAAAAACVPLVDDLSHVAGVIENYLITGIPPQPENGEISFEVDRNLAESKPGKNPCVNTRLYLRQNHLHGDLLAINAILTGTCHAMNSSDKIELIRRMASSLPQRVWVAKDESKNPCSVTRAAMISMLCKIYEISREVESMDGLNEQDRCVCQVIVHMCQSVSCSFYLSNFKRHVPGTEVGMSSFRSCTARFLILVTISSFERQQLSLDEALQRLQLLVFCESREELGEGLASVRRICEKAEKAGEKQGSSIHFSDSISKLIDIWSKGFHVITSVEDQDILVAALRLLNVLLRYLSHHLVQSEVEKRLIDIGMVSSLLDIVERHSCVDVRESGIVLVGQFVSTQKRNMQLIRRWISFVEDMTSLQQPPTCRIAACVSLEQSGLEYQCWKGDNIFGAELAVWGLLSLAHMVEDDTVEVRTTALDVLHRCMRQSPEEGCHAADILTTLMFLFENLGTQFSQTETLFHYLWDLLSKEDVLQRDTLMVEILGVIGAQSFTGTKTGSLISSRGLTKTNRFLHSDRKKSTGLFRLEEDIDGGELMLRLQLVTWCYRNVILRGHYRRAGVQSVRELCISLCRMVESEARQGVRKAGDSVLNGAIFTLDGFVRCYKSILRLLLGVSLLEACTSDNEVQTEKCVAQITGSLMEVNQNYGEDLHPILCSALDGMHRLLTKDDENDPISSLQKVLFLLRI